MLPTFNCSISEHTLADWQTELFPKFNNGRYINFTFLFKAKLDESVIAIERYINTMAFVLGQVIGRQYLDFCGRVFLHVAISLNNKLGKSLLIGCLLGGGRRRFLEILLWLVAFLRKAARGVLCRIGTYILIEVTCRDEVLKSGACCC